MSDETGELGEVEQLRGRAAELEGRLQQAESRAQARVMRAELAVEAVRAGMVDLDGLKLVDFDRLEIDADGSVVGGAQVMARLRRDKPWLFGGGGSSSGTAAPPASAGRAKLATEMTLEEWRAARAELLRRR